jgi:hypothetical protein
MKNPTRNNNTRSVSPRSGSPRTATVPETNINAWLNEIGMGAYAEQFIKEDIDLDVLPYLTEQHLIEILNITTLGARLRILQHIKNLPPSNLQTQTAAPNFTAASYEALREEQQLKREIDRRNADIKRLEGIVQHLVPYRTVQLAPPPPPPPPQLNNNIPMNRKRHNSGLRPPKRLPEQHTSPESVPGYKILSKSGGTPPDSKQDL